MKKTIAFLTLLALVAIPVSAMAAKTGDFELGGYIRLHTRWDSTSSVNSNMGIVANRNNAARPANEGRMYFTAQDTRFNFTIKGPEVWGAKTQGFIEMDFAGVQDPQVTVTNSLNPRLRHAWFRMDWPGGWQLLMGQYWGVFCNFWPDTIQSGPLFAHGMSTQRLAQIRVTYKTAPWTFAAFAGAQNDEVNENRVVPFNDPFGWPWLPGTQNFVGQRAIMPQFGVQVEYEQDLWGKAAFFSRPRGFTANVSFGIQRTKFDGGGIAAATWGQNQYGAIGFNNEYQQGTIVTPWKVQASMFIPILPTHTQDLTGTASLQLQFYIGQGLRAFGNEWAGSDSYFRFDSFDNNGWPVYNRKPTQRYGGYAQAQYYINNEWYLSYVYGFAKAYGVTQARNPLLATVFNPDGYVYASTGDLMRDTQEHNVSLFYRPNANFKFGLGYAYLNTNYFQITRGPGNLGSYATRRGDNHRVQFAGWFFF
jgi:hypothetical protein